MKQTKIEGKFPKHQEIAAAIVVEWNVKERPYPN